MRAAAGPAGQLVAKQATQNTQPVRLKKLAIVPLIHIFILKLPSYRAKLTRPMI